MSRCRSGLIDAKRSLSKAGHENPDDEAEPLTGQKSISYKTPHSIDRGVLRRQMCGLLKKLMLF